jgi:hypothetical protein
VRARAKKLGYRVHRRGNEYSLVHPSGRAISVASDLKVFGLLLDVEEGKVKLQIFTPCGMRCGAPRS